MFKKKEIIIPKLNEGDFEEYIDLKKSQVVIFDDTFEKSLTNDEYREYMVSDELLTSLCEFVAVNYMAKSADKNIKDNVLKIISYIRANKEYKTQTEKKELISELNGLILTLNSTSEENNIDFYRRQFYQRTGQTPTPFWDAVYDKDFMEQRKESLNYSITCDYPSIIDIREVDNKQEFFSEVVPDNLLSHYFINTIYNLFEEYPALFNDKRFLERTEFILENNKLLLKNKPSPYQITDEDQIDNDLLPRSKKLLKKLKTIK